MKIKLEIRHYMILFLSILALVGMPNLGFQKVFFHMVVAVLSAIVVDSIINYIKFKRLIISPSTIITGLIVGEVLSFDFPLYIPLISSTLAVLSKQFIFYQNKHIFNPAATGLLIVSLAFSNPISWWVASNIWLTIIFGLFILYMLREYGLTASYLIMHTLLLAIISLVTGSAFLALFSITNLYFIAFMLIEPITSPVKKKARIFYGMFIALISIAAFYLVPSVDHSILGLLVANLFSRILDKRFS